MIITVASAAAIAGYYFSSQRAVPPPAPSLTGTPTADAAARLWALKLPDGQGKEQPLAQWRGQVLVVNFWATWCPPCREETPEFARISGEYAAKGVQFVGISLDPAEKVVEFQREFQVPYPLLIGNLEQMELTGDLGNRARALPFTLVLGRDGQVGYVRVGRLPGRELEEALTAALQQG